MPQKRASRYRFGSAYGLIARATMKPVDQSATNAAAAAAEAERSMRSGPDDAGMTTKRPSIARRRAAVLSKPALRAAWADRGSVERERVERLVRAGLGREARAQLAVQSARLVECEVDPVRIARCIVEPLRRKLDFEDDAFAIHRFTFVGWLGRAASLARGGEADCRAGRNTELLAGCRLQVQVQVQGRVANASCGCRGKE
ncbi:hypothetical protein DO70_4484 [Burkholderia pseudomallei]|nr:hypothetical protein DO70_4484 [Burkholderia pseudomallei]